MGDAKLGIGLDQRLVQHLLLLIVHIRDQQGEKDHQLLHLPGQHGVNVAVIQLVDQLHLRGDGGADLHDVDTGGRAGSQLDIGAAHFVAGPFELVPLQRCQDKALDAPHPHPQGHDLHGVGLARPGGAADGEVGVLVDLRIERVNDAQGVVVPVEAQQDTVIVGQLEAGEHIGGGGPAGQNIALGFALQTGIYAEERHGGAQGGLLLKHAVRHLDVHGLHQVGHLLLAPLQLLIASGGHGDEH